MYMYKYRDNKDILLDGRSIFFVSQELNCNRGTLALILKGERECAKEFAEKLVNRLQPNKKVEDYFIVEED